MNTENSTIDHNELDESNSNRRNPLSKKLQ